jgi:hypothetical protein
MRVVVLVVLGMSPIGGFASLPVGSLGEEINLLPQVRLSHYQEPTPSIPSDLLYRGRPLEAACLERLLADGHTRVGLETCPRPVTTLDCLLSENHDQDPWWDLRGYRGYCYRVSEPGPGGLIERQHNVIYKYLGKLAGHHALLVEIGLGSSSSGVDRHVIGVDVAGNPPSVVLQRTFVPPSRVVPLDARVSGSKLLYTGAVSAAQLLELAGLDLATLDVSAEALSDSRMLADADIAEFENDRLKRVWLLPHTGTKQERSGRAACFADAHQRYRDGKRTELSPSALKEFATKVGSCLNGR